MSREALENARQLIANRRFRAARKLLEPLDSLEADELLLELDMLENQRPSVLRSGYVVLVLLGILFTLVLGIGLFTLAGGFERARVILAVPTALPTLPPDPTRTSTPIPTNTPVPTDTAVPTVTDTPTPSRTPTRDLPPTWTPTDRPTVQTPDATGTRLAQAVATGQALVAATGTMAARNSVLRTNGTQVLGIVGTPDEACATDARVWWRDARLIAADTFFNLANDYDVTIALVLEQPDQYRSLLDNLRVDFLAELREEVMRVPYPACAHTAREMLLAHMQARLLAYRAISAGNTDSYTHQVEQAATYQTFFERELGILRVQRQ